MSANKFSSYVALAFAGLISGFLTCASGRFLELFGSAGQNIYTFIGAIFGFVLVAYWWIFQGFRSIWRSVGFILSCTVAYACAVAAGMNAPVLRKKSKISTQLRCNNVTQPMVLPHGLFADDRALLESNSPRNTQLETHRTDGKMG